MPRIPTVDSRDALPAEHQVVWDNILASRGRVAGPWLVMLHTPPIADMVAHLGALLRFDLPFDPPTRELAILATVRELKCEFEWAAHVAEGRKVGVREEAIDAVLDDLQRITRQVGFFSIHLGPAQKVLPDGRNAHLIQETVSWWLLRLAPRFEVFQLQTHQIYGHGFWIIVRPKS